MPDANRMNADYPLFHAADSLGVVADARARAGETLALAARHLDASLVDVLRILREKLAVPVHELAEPIVGVLTAGVGR